MGIIQKQSIISSLFILIGVAIGALNVLVLSPKVLTPDEFGLTRAMIDISLTLATLCSLGSVTVIYKFYPYYKDYLGEKKNDLPMVTAMVSLAGFLVVVVLGYIFRDFIIRKLGKSPGLAAYFYTVYPFTFLLLLFNWLEAFGWAVKKTTATNFLKETGVRLMTTLLLIIYALSLISIKSFIQLFSLLYLVPALILMYILIKSGRWRFSITPISAVTRRFKSRMISFGLFIFGSNFLNVLSKTNDTILIFGLRGLKDTGVFAIANYLIAVLDIPNKSLNSISASVLAEAWKNKDTAAIDNIYRKTVSNLLVIGLGLFGIIFLNIHNLVAFLGKNYAEVEAVVFLLGLAKVLDMGTGINSMIIGTSNYWKFDFYTNIIYTLISLPLNYVLIKFYGLIGVAFAALISQTIFNSIRFVFLYRKFGFQPYTGKHAQALLIAAIVYVVVYFIPRFPNIFLDTFVRGLVYVLLFAPAMYVSKTAPDLNNLVISFKNRLLGSRRA